MIRVGIVEGHPLLARAWGLEIAGSMELSIAWTASTVGEAKDAIRRLAPEVVLLGIDVPGRDELEAPDLPPVVSLALRSGPMTAEALRRALLDEAAGERAAIDQRGGAGALTAREQQVMVLLAQGKTNREIADILEISVKTIDSHRGHVLKKLGLRNNAELVLFAAGHGYVGL